MAVAELLSSALAELLSMAAVQLLSRAAVELLTMAVAELLAATQNVREEERLDERCRRQHHTDVLSHHTVLQS